MSDQLFDPYAEGLDVLAHLGAVVRSLQKEEQTTDRAAELAIRANGAAHQATVAAVLVARDLLTAICDGAGNDRGSLGLADAIAKARDLMAGESDR